MKKFLLTAGCCCIIAVCALCGCTPKPVTLWCESPITGARFSFEYSAANSAYDGLNRTFTIKTEDDFNDFLTDLDEYAGMMEFADNSELTAYSFIKSGDVFVCYPSDDEGRYTLRASVFTIDGYDFSYPPTERNFDYSVELDYSGINNYVTTTVQDWDYFKNFYSNIESAVVTNETKTVVFENELHNSVTLNVGDGVVNWVIDFRGGQQ